MDAVTMSGQLTLNYADHQSRYHHRGWTVLESAIPSEVAHEWADCALSLAARDAPSVHRIDTDGDGVQRAMDEGGAYRHVVLETAAVQEHMPALWGYYLAVPAVVAPIVCRSVILSPYQRSAVNVKVYFAPGGTQGWHRDTNAVTALLYLTDDGHPTIVESLAGEVADVPHAAGDLLLMQGRRCRHCVPPMSDDVPPRVTVPLNLYHPDDTWRPEGIDELVYGDSPS